MGIQCSGKFLEDYSPWTKSTPVLVCHLHPQRDAYGLKVLHFTPKNDNLTLNVANSSAKAILVEVYILSLRQIPCLDRAPLINISNEYRALSLTCCHFNQSCCHSP